MKSAMDRCRTTLRLVLGFKGNEIYFFGFHLMSSFCWCITNTGKKKRNKKKHLIIRELWYFCFAPLKIFEDGYPMFLMNSEIF